MKEVKFFVSVTGEDPVVVSVKDDINRPNNLSVSETLEEWIHDNYGFKEYEYWLIDDCETHCI
ncbi:hypothetical protein JMA_37280 (plasmid) [Jeotgalibacillus malaysiensis]|uniref:Uncharacterized protein n=1 Tax=Jeotgalibacillus malaysiensis TaxID=1508404 RepID=A0A0B5ASF4_9BACL|nr:hypothetical protein [Jeotgalibacillus malaysiensis]AJD93046.1 hypothetical protein JMA_37280 [Jeotgalibacillus malaysiensis]